MKRHDDYEYLALHAESRGDCTFAKSDAEINQAYQRAAAIAIVLLAVGGAVWKWWPK